MEQRMNINWYPGHMKKTKELLQQNIKLIDILLEVVDSRIPISSKNPDIDRIASGKARVLVLNKEDLAEPKETAMWKKYYDGKGFVTLSMNAADRSSSENLIKSIHAAFAPIKEKLKARGIINRSPRIMVVGIPNSGKSTIINTLSNKKSAQTGDRPGVTKGKQWVRIKGNFELLDTPGILWPKFEDDRISKMLAFTGAIKEEVLDIEEIAYELIRLLKKDYFENLKARYDCILEEMTALETMDAIALNRAFLQKANEIDYLRTAKTVLNEFRSGQLGRITLERLTDFK